MTASKTLGAHREHPPAAAAMRGPAALGPAGGAREPSSAAVEGARWAAHLPMSIPPGAASMHKRLPGLLVAAALLGGCGADLTPRSQITGLRVLAVKVEPPEVGPGDPASWSALVALPDGGGMDLSYVLAQCTPTIQGCLELAEAQALVGEDLAPQIYAASAVRAGQVTLSGEAAEIAAPPTRAPMTLLDGLEDPNAGADAQATLSVCVQCEAATPSEDPGAPTPTGQPQGLVADLGDESNLTLKRLRVSTSTTPNLNPDLSQVSFTAPDGTSVDVLHLGAVDVQPGEAYALSFSLAPGSAQALSDGQSPRLEDLRLQVYASQGSFSRDRVDVTTQDNGAGAASLTYIAPTQWGSDDLVSLHAVIWDNRGGTDWLTVHVRPTP